MEYVKSCLPKGSLLDTTILLYLYRLLKKGFYIDETIYKKWIKNCNI